MHNKKNMIKFIESRYIYDWKMDKKTRKKSKIASSLDNNEYLISCSNCKCST